VLALESNPDAERRLEAALAHGTGPAAGDAARLMARLRSHEAIWRRSSVRLAPLLQVDRRRGAALITDVRTHGPRPGSWRSRAPADGAVRTTPFSLEPWCDAAISRWPSPGR
jgi:hypothetical protein